MSAYASSQAATSGVTANVTGNGNGLTTAPGQVKKDASTQTAASSTAATSVTTTTPPTTATAVPTTTAPVVTAATVGDPTQPQPLSTADLNPGGANNAGDCGAYCSTRDGSASANGSDTGKAIGEPCAGCVGKADNKNPPGQQPDGTDHNKGYECDANNGIGKTNPAHTGCTTTTTPPTTCAATNSCGSTTDCTITNTCGSTSGDCTLTNTCGATTSDCTVTNTCPSTPAGCVPMKVNDFCSTVLGVQHQRTPTAPPTVVLGEKVTRTPKVTPTVTPQALPFTGARLSGMLSLAVWLLLLGCLAVALGRRPVSPVAAPSRL